MPTAAPVRHRAEQPQIKRIRVRSSWEGSMRARHELRGFQFHTDEPADAGGENTAPTPMEYVVAALAGCLAVVTEMVTKERQLTLHGLQIETIATMDRRGVAGIADVSPHFQDVTLRARFKLDDALALPSLQREVERRCPAFNLLKDAGVPVRIDWAVSEVER